MFIFGRLSCNITGTKHIQDVPLQTSRKHAKNNNSAKKAMTTCH